MPKKISVPPARWSSPELKECYKKAKAAAGRFSKLTDDDLRLIARIAWDRTWLFRYPQPGLHDYKKEELSDSVARCLAWAVVNDCAAAGRALVAAEKQALKMDTTPEWVLRRICRAGAWINAARAIAAKGYGKVTGKAFKRFDIQAIREEAEKTNCPGIGSVTDKAIHKALRLERMAAKADSYFSKAGK